MKYLNSWVFAIVILGCSQAPIIENTSDKLQRRWTRNTLIKDYNGFRAPHKMSPLLTENLVIQGNAIDGIKAFHRKTGQEVWQIPLEHGVEGGAALDDGKLFFGANDGHFYAVNAETGNILWKVGLSSESVTAPIVRGSYVFHLTADNTLRALEAATGKEIWVQTRAVKAVMTVRGQTTPLFHEGILFVGFSDGHFSAINAENGREIWTKKIGDDKKFNDVDASARVHGKCVLVSSYANSLYCLNKKNGAIEWRHDAGGYQPVLVSGDKIYHPTGRGEIHVLDGGSGKLLNKIALKNQLSSEIIAFNDFLIFGESQGALRVIEKSSLKNFADFRPGKGIVARPTLDKSTGEIFILSNEANLYKIKLLGKKSNPFPWSFH